MKKLISAVVLALTVGLVAAPAVADDTSTLPHLRTSEIPSCYLTGAASPCAQALTGDQGDITFDWFCTNPTSTVECNYEAQAPGVVAWTQVLYSVIDRLHYSVAHLQERIARQHQRIMHQRAIIRHLRHRLSHR